MGGKLEREAVAQQLLLNMLDHAAKHHRLHRSCAVVMSEADPRWGRLQRIRLECRRAEDPLQALRDNELVIVAATADRLRSLAEHLPELEAFQDRGGWLVIWGLEPEGLPFFNRIVDHEHLIRPFEVERVVLNYPLDRLAAGLTLRDVAMDTGRPMYSWMALKEPDRDAFRWVVDHTDIAPFARFPDGLVMGKGKAHPGADHEPRNLVNGFTSDDNWVFTYTTILDEGHSTRLPLELPREEELEALIVHPSRLYHPVTKLHLYFDEDPTPLVAPIPVRDPPVAEEIPLHGRRARKLTIEIAEWGERGHRNIVVLDNLWLRVRRSESYLRRVSSLLNIGVLMDYRRGSGGVLLNQVHVPEREVNPENAVKKATIVRTLLANLGATFEGSRVEIARERWRFTPVVIPEHRFTAYRDQRGKPGWFDGGDLSALPVGRRIFAGVEFDVFDFATSPVPSVVALAGWGSEVRERVVEGLPVGAWADALFFLHTYHPGPGLLEWRRRVADALQARREPPRAPQAAVYRVIYDDGAREEIEVVFGEHIGAWNDERPLSLPGADLAWASTGSGTARGAVWVMRWINPHPEKVIRSIDFARAGDHRLGAPAMLAISCGDRVE